MDKIENLTDLLIEQGRELYNSNEQELKELPRIGKHVASSSLKKIINKEVQTIENQQVRLRSTLSKLDAIPDGRKCKTTTSILKEARNRINKSKNADVRDAAIISSLQQLGHKKVADLGATSAYAREIGEEESANLLHDSLQEEKQIGKELIKLAKTDINKKALQMIIA